MRVRFAPSPTGRLHVGNARTALFNWLLARGHRGTFILRVEDTDVDRSTPESEAAILRDLQWLGLNWDEGPDVGGPRGPYRQSERLHLYKSYASELMNAGCAYYCFCSIAQLDAERQAALAEGRPTRYAGTCRRLSREHAASRIGAGEKAAVRFKVPESREVVFPDAVRGEVRFRTDVIGDPVILRADGHPAYNFAVVIDDALMEITDVVRGEDHLSNTPRQILMYDALGFTPPRFGHLALVMGPDHSPLSKRHGATSVSEFRAKGYLPEALVNYLALIGWSPRGSGSSRSGRAGARGQAGERTRKGDAENADERSALGAGGGADEQAGKHGGEKDEGSEVLPLDELARRFSLEDVGHSAGVFDEEKLAWVNRRYLKAADPVRIAELSVPHFNKAGTRMAPDRRGMEFLASAMSMASVDRIDQIPSRLAFLFDYAPEDVLMDPAVLHEMSSEEPRKIVRALADALAGGPRLDRERFRAMAHDLKARTFQKGRGLFHPIRVALTGRPEGPELDLAVPAIDRGADLPADAGLPPVLGCRERAAAFLRALDRQTRDASSPC
jgi:nondiscriminating glutamyl-tRNA synthetase